MTQGAYQPPSAPPGPAAPTGPAAAASENRAVVDLLHALSHDLRGPLTVVTGVLQTMTRSGEGTGDPDLASLVQSAFESTGRMREILDDFVATVDIVFGDTQARPRPVDPVAVLRQAIAQDQGLAGVTRVRGSDLPRVTIDPLQLGRAVVCLARAELARGSRRVTVDVAAGTDRLVVVVVGDGLGAPPGASRSVGAGQASPPRIGLDERMATALTGVMGGRLSVVPLPGGGSTFRIVIPRVADDG